MKPLCEATSKLLKPIYFGHGDRVEVYHDLDDDGRPSFVLDAYQLKDGKGGRFFASSDLHNGLKRIPSLKGIDHGWEHCYCPYTAPASDMTVDILDSCFAHDAKGHNRLIFHDDDAEVLYQSIRAKSIIADQCAKRIADFKADKTVPEHDFELCADLPLSGYQIPALVNGMALPGYGYWLKQGCGKTAPAIATICNVTARRGKPEAARIIIVCPKGIKTNWQNEIKRFSTRAGIVSIIHGNEVTRIKQYQEAFAPPDGAEFSVIVIGYELLVADWNILQHIEWDLAIADEAHYFCSTRTTRFEYMMMLRDRSAKRLGLTGTPQRNTLNDLYAQFEWLGHGYSGFGSYSEYKAFYSKHVRNAGEEIFTGGANIPMLQERIARHAYIVHKNEALPNLPPKVYDIHDVEMTGYQWEKYRQLASQLALEIEDEMNSGRNKSMVVNNVLTKLLRLAHITSGFFSWDPIEGPDGTILQPKEIEYLSPNPKIEALMDLCLDPDKGQDEKTIIWACWDADIDYITAALEQHGLPFVKFTGSTSDKKRIEAEYLFNNDPAYRFFVGNAAAGGCGLNLLGYPPGAGDDCLTDCTHMIYYSQNWSSVIREQSEDRAHRRGTRRPVRITDLMVAFSIDEQIRERVTEKRLDALSVTDVRHILEAVRTGVLAA
jgi:SNF2 family DNA or RNA helicase